MSALTRAVTVDIGDFKLAAATGVLRTKEILS
jgi:hypothetical protein